MAGAGSTGAHADGGGRWAQCSEDPRGHREPLAAAAGLSAASPGLTSTGAAPPPA